MEAPELSPRLRAIADRVPQGARLADVGTDHAYLPAALLREGRVPSAIASDVREGPLERGRETARRWGVPSITFRCCDGLAGIQPEEADVIVIAGMGGQLMAGILAAAPWTRKKQLILQPMSTQPQLRKWLTENGYVIREEAVVREEEKFYVILSVTGGSETGPYTSAELWAGRQRREWQDPNRLAWLDRMLERREKAIAGMRQGHVAGDTLAAEEALLQGLRAIREEWSAWQQ